MFVMKRFNISKKIENKITKLLGMHITTNMNKPVEERGYYVMTWQYFFFGRIHKLKYLFLKICHKLTGIEPKITIEESKTNNWINRKITATCIFGIKELNRSSSYVGEHNEINHDEYVEYLIENLKNKVTFLKQPTKFVHKHDLV